MAHRAGLRAAMRDLELRIITASCVSESHGPRDSAGVRPMPIPLIAATSSRQKTAGLMSAMGV
eukprot:CAMPEP_0117655642 /NCGR_PEP_ID=MMETSP0804-20121206/4388_1 /TAXON_ID=1074897 /ORGANISM="Tetraselmis astigmatica, Strain CCMP880" /LENGTH=62 /DNA_ID=CAMNT_0005462007 /DNA_START=12 /DNA_END=200 /DNA_ORIENTATION=+